MVGAGFDGRNGRSLIDDCAGVLFRIDVNLDNRNIGLCRGPFEHLIGVTMDVMTC